MKLSEFPKTSRDTEIGRLIREVRRRYNLADEVARKFMLASALEPLSNKDGCTTRFVDLKESKRLELFVAAGINSGFAIRHLVDHLIVNKTLIGSYKFMIEAVVTSKLNRKGGKINHGILEAIIPLIATQVIFYDKIKDEPSMIFGLVGPLLSNTGKEDVEDLLQAKRIANKISGVEKKYPLRQHKVVSIYDYYFFEVNAELAEGNLTAVLHNQQSKAFAVDVALRHYWTPTISSTLIGDYYQVTYSAGAVNPAIGSAFVNNGSTVPFGWGMTNYKEFLVGTGLEWNPIKGVGIGTEIAWTHGITSRPVGLASDATLMATGLPAFKSQADLIRGRVRMYRAF